MCSFALLYLKHTNLFQMSVFFLVTGATSCFLQEQQGRCSISWKKRSIGNAREKVLFWAVEIDESGQGEEGKAEEKQRRMEGSEMKAMWLEFWWRGIDKMKDLSLSLPLPLISSG